MRIPLKITSDSIARIIVLICLVPLWYSASSRGFWLDELITVFLIQADTAAELTVRVTEFHSQSPMYYWIAWKWSGVFGVSEMSLRMLSGLMVAVSALVVMRSCRSFVSEEHGSWLAVLWLCGGAAFSSACEARPYALALLGVALTLSFLMDIPQRFSIRSIVCYSLSLVIVFYAHYTYVLVAAPEILWLYLVAARQQRSRGLAAVLVISVVLLLGYWPLQEHLRLVKWRHQASSWVLGPSWTDFGAILFSNLPCALVIVPLALGGWFRWQEAKRRGGNLASLSSPYFLFMLLWFTVPLLLLAVSALNGQSIFFERYARWSGFGFVGTIWLGVSKLIPGAARRSVYFLLSGLLLLCSAGLSVARDNWRELGDEVATLTESGVSDVVLYSEMVETGIPEWLLDSNRHSFFEFPLRYYSPTNTRFWILPFRIDEKRTEKYIDDIFLQLTSRRANFAVVVRYPLKEFPLRLLTRIEAAIGTSRLACYEILRPDRGLSVWVFKVRGTGL